MTERAHGVWLPKSTLTEDIASRQDEARGRAMARITGEMVVERARALALFGKA